MLATQSQFQSVSPIKSIVQIESHVTELCIIGDGAVGLASGCLFAGGIHQLRVLKISTTSEVEQLPQEYEIRQRGSAVPVSRARTGFVKQLTDCSIALKGVDAVLIASPATEYGAIAKIIAPFLRNGQSIVLINSPLGGALEFENRLNSCNRDLQANIVEFGTMFDSAKVENGLLVIRGRRDKVSFCGNSRNATRKALESITSLSNVLVPCSNVLERGFSEVEKFLRPSLLLFAIMGARGKDLECISNIINPSLTAVVSAMERELRALAKHYKCIVHNFFDTLHDFSGARWEDADCLDQALISVSRSLLEQSRAGNSADDSLPLETAIEILKADIRETLILVSELARVSRTPVPVINSVIDLATAATRTELIKKSRTLADLGMLGFDVSEIIKTANR